MKKTFFVIAFMLFGAFAFANSAHTYELPDKKIEFYESQDCDEYAQNAADEEVGWFENYLTQGFAYAASYSYWLGLCEGVTAGGSELLDPVFIGG